MNPAPASILPATAPDLIRSGWISGLIGVVIFAGSLPATRIAVSGFDPLFLTAGRATVAALLALPLLLLLRQPRPGRADLASLAISAGGVVIGFPLLTALALQHISSAHSVVFIGLLPLSTAVFAVFRAGERLPASFWFFALAGSALVVGYAVLGGIRVSMVGDGLMLAAILVCGLGYAEGARLARHLGGWQVISWALVLSLPAMLVTAWLRWPASFAQVSAAAWAGFAYVSLFSMFLGFVFWYRGLARGGIAAVGQLQLLQPFLGLGLAAWLLREPVSPLMLGVTLATVACVAGARHSAAQSTRRGAGPPA